MSEPRALRCGRLTDHEPHEWERPVLAHGHGPFAATTYACTGHVLTTLAEREWADRADFDDKRDDDLREWLREGWAS